MSSELTSIRNMTLATIHFAIMAVLVKALGRIPTEQVVFFRGVVALILCLVMIRAARVSLWGTNKKWLILRGMFGTIGLVAFFYSVKRLPLATAQAIQNLSPLFTIFFAQFILSERVSRWNWVFFITAMIGALVIKGFDSDVTFGPFMIAMIGAVGAGLAYNCVSRLKSTEHPYTIIFYFPLITVPTMAPLTYANWVQPNLQEWLLLIGVGVVVQIAQYFMTLAYSGAATTKVSIIYYLGTVLGVVNGYLFFNEVLTAWAAAGIGIILLSVVANTLIKEKH